MNISLEEILKNKNELLKSLSEDEKSLVLSILNEYEKDGYSNTYNKLLYSDYTEIPVDITTFLHNKDYLGNALYDQEGRFTLFPYWEEKLKDIFPTNTTTNYNTIIFTGAIGLGKSTIAVICLLYMLYRLLCLKDPYLYYGMQPIDKISISLMNITIENAKGVALDKMNQMILSSNWFMSHGKMSGISNLEYVPDKHIELITASSNNQVIGRAIFCLDGKTRIVTSEGVKCIEDLVDKDIKVVGVDNEGNIVLSDSCTVKPTIKTNEEYQIELEDGSVIKCTPNHLLMLKDGTYKMAKDLTLEDELAEAQYIENATSYKDFIDNIIKTRGQWDIPDGEYCEAHHIIPKCLGGEGSARSGKKRSKHPNIIWLYAHEHFIAHKLLALENPDNSNLVCAWSMMAFPKGKTKRQIEISSNEYETLRKLQSDSMKGENNNLYGREPWNKGKTNVYSKESLDKIRKPRPHCQGIKKSEETRKKMSVAVKKRFEEHPETFKNGVEGKVSITNGIINKYIDKDKELPEGFRYGQKSRDSYVIKNKEAYSKLRSELSSGNKNSMFGNGYKISGGNNGHAIYIYTYKGIDYQCRDDLMVVLKQEFPTISESTIRRIMRNNYTDKITSKYQGVIDNLTWRLKK